MNATSIILIPKGFAPEGLSYFWPISCCNVLYKCITKVLANHLKTWLPNFISPNQLAFAQWMSISNNVLLCQEFVLGYRLNYGPPRCLLKVDWRKAYNSIH